MTAPWPVRIVQGMVLGLAVLLGVAAGASAHEIRPALLQIEERETGLFDVIWKVPVKDGNVPDIQPVFPPFMKQIGRTSKDTQPGTRLERSTYSSNGKPLVGEMLTIDKLSTMQIDVLVRLKLADGTSHSAILKPGSPSFVVPALASKSEVAWSYWQLGLTHILEGVDHLLFLLALMFLVSGFWALIKTITAFTLAHSVTLALATLGIVNVPPAPTEAVIALSIAFLAAEIVRKNAGQTGLTQRSPWLVACFFGLFHGLGFAGALTNIGLPQHEIPLALLMFNIGVEAGQVLFIVCVVAIMETLRRIVPPISLFTERFAPFVIGSIAAYWTIDRVVSFLPVFA